MNKKQSKHGLARVWTALAMMATIWLAGAAGGRRRSARHWCAHSATSREDDVLADADDVEAQAATASLNFNTYGQGATWRGFTGVDVAYKTDAIGRLFLGAEVGLSSGGAAFEGRAGFDLAL